MMENWMGLNKLCSPKQGRSQTFELVGAKYNREGKKAKGIDRLSTS